MNSSGGVGGAATGGSSGTRLGPEESRSSPWKMFSWDIETVPLLIITGMVFGAFGWWVAYKFADPQDGERPNVVQGPVERGDIVNDK